MWWWIIGCAQGPRVADTPRRVAPICAPWDAVGLPLDGAAIVHCDERRLTVELPAGSADAAGPGWRLAVRIAGWEEDVDTTAPGLVNVRYRQGERILDLSLIDAADHTVAVVTTP
ncbi:MAG: hypothetical protein ABMB14_11505 [Myxococcota bacterium]